MAPVHVSVVSKGTFQRRTLIDRTNSFFMDQIDFDSIWSKNIYEFASYRGKPRITYSQCFFPIGITQHLTQHPADNHRGV